MIRNNRSIKGFTLVEMSVVLVIIGLILVAAITTATAQLNLSRAKTTREKEYAVKNALITFIARNNRLPCPAIPTLAPGVAGYGAEASLPGICTGVPTSGAGNLKVFTGILPWTSIGLTDESASDGYYNRYTYQVTASATALTSSTIAAMKGNNTLHSATPIVFGAPAIGNQTNDCTVNNFNACAAVVVIVSHGNNGYGAYGTGGNRLTLPTGADELENTNGDQSFVIKDFRDDPVNPFDDILLPLTSSDLLSPLINDGAIKSYQGQLASTIEKINGNIYAYANTNRTGAAGSRLYPLPPDLSFIPNATYTDPWGNLINYQNIAGSISSTTPSLTSAYVLQSKGPDGIASSADDITITVNVTDAKSTFASSGW